MMWRKHSHTRKRMGRSSVTMNVEEQLALDETVARALHYVEEKLAATSLSETTVAEAEITSYSGLVLQETPPDPANDVPASTRSPSLATRQDDIDPDNMSYEALQSLGESIGTESRGLSDDVISLLPSSLYKSCKGENEECAICLMSYISQEVVITLPCKHHYHSHCVTQWLKIKKACPVCNNEVFGS